MLSIHAMPWQVLCTRECVLSCWVLCLCTVQLYHVKCVVMVLWFSGCSTVKGAQCSPSILDEDLVCREGTSACLVLCCLFATTYSFQHVPAPVVNGSHKSR
jgi:hypothetical protein